VNRTAEHKTVQSEPIDHRKAKAEELAGKRTRS
jgi:hypothetical protein